MNGENVETIKYLTIYSKLSFGLLKYKYRNARKVKSTASVKSRTLLCNNSGYRLKSNKLNPLLSAFSSSGSLCQSIHLLISPHMVQQVRFPDPERNRSGSSHHVLTYIIYDIMVILQL